MWGTIAVWIGKLIIETAIAEWVKKKFQKVKHKLKTKTK